MALLDLALSAFPYKARMTCMEILVSHFSSVFLHMCGPSFHLVCASVSFLQVMLSKKNDDPVLQNLEDRSAFRGCHQTPSDHHFIQKIL